MQDGIRLLYCGGDKDYDGILFSALSAMRRTKRPLFIYVFTAALDRPDGKPVDPSKANYLRALLRRRDDGSTLELLDLGDLLSTFYEVLETTARADDPYVFLRLLCDRTELKGKVLYLDCDTLFSSDPGPVFDRDLEGCPVGGVPDRYGSFFFDTGYINPGVLLFDLDRARETDFFTKARKLLLGYRLSRPVADAVNYAGCGIMRLPAAFNEQSALRRDTVIRHYCARVRLFPYPHRDDGSPKNGYDMNTREYRLFKRVYEEYLLQREGRA